MGANFMLPILGMPRILGLKMNLIAPFAIKLEGKYTIFYQKRALARNQRGQVGGSDFFCKMLRGNNFVVKWIFVTPSSFFASSIFRLDTHNWSEGKLKPG